MGKRGKKYLEALQAVDRQRKYPLEEAISLAKRLAFARFDETVEIAIRLGVNPRHADQMVRGGVV
ncbi:MAG: 50S ribosomal protein L1, partial [Nitrospinota bacterium]